MRRTVVTMQWKAGTWTVRTTARVSSDPCLQQGIEAYAAKQANISLNLSKTFYNLWCELRLKANEVLHSKQPLDNAPNALCEPLPPFGGEDEVLAEPEEYPLDSVECWDAEGLEFDE